jgi:hypothetical protein
MFSCKDGTLSLRPTFLLLQNMAKHFADNLPEKGQLIFFCDCPLPRFFCHAPPEDCKVLTEQIQYANNPVLGCNPAN